MVFVVEMWGGRDDCPGKRFYSVHGDVWKGLQDLGQANGWAPSGTEMHLAASYSPRKVAEVMESDYEPEYILAKKLVSAQDSFAWASSLRAALDRKKVHETQPRMTLLVEGMSESALRRVNSPLNELRVREFIDFLELGEFWFAWDD